MKIDVIIAAYNEERYISGVLQTLANIDFINKIIVVDDGSDDATADKIRQSAKQDARVFYLENSSNQGKTSAILKGVSFSSAEYLLFLDADLSSFSAADLHLLMKPVISGDYDMSVIERGGDTRGLIGWTGLSRLWGGERFLSRDLLKKINLKPEDNYLMESKMNLYIYENGLKATTVLLPNVFAEYKFHKLKFWQGIMGYMKIGAEIVGYCGISGILKQYLALEHNKLRNIYKVNYNTRHLIFFLPVIIPSNLAICSFYFLFLNLQVVLSSFRITPKFNS